MLNSLKSLKRMKLMAFLIMLQLAIGLSLLNSTAIIIDENNKKMSYFEKLFNFENTYMINIVRSYDENLEIQEESEVDSVKRIKRELDTLYKFNQELDVLKDKSIIIDKNIYFCSSTPIIEEIDKIQTKYSDLSGGQREDYTAKINVNYDFIDRYNLKISKGRGFKKDDFNINYKTESIPIIMGEEYDKHVKIGDKFKGLVNTGELIDENSNLKFNIAEVTYEVIGFYAHNGIPAVRITNEIIRNMKYSDAFVIIPTIKDLAYLNEATCISDGGLFLEISDYNYLSYIENKFKNDLDKINLNIKFKALNEEFLEYKKTLIKDVINSLLLGATLIFLSIVGITSVLLGELNKRKKEFGIRIASGATITTLCKEIILENLWLVSFSAIISFMILGIKSIAIQGENIIRVNVLVVDIFIIVFLTLIISIIPIIRIKKMNPVELLRGK